MKSKYRINPILVFLSLFLNVSLLAMVVYTQLIYEKPPLSDTEEKEKLLSHSKRRIFIEGHKLDKIVLNLYSRRNRLRYLNVEMIFRPLKPEYNDLFQSNKAFIYDAIIDIAGRMTVKELNSVYGKIILENRIKKRIHQFLGKKTLREIFFTHFVIQ